MARVLLEVPSDLTGRDLHKFLKDNKKQLIAQKKAETKRFDSPVGLTAFYLPDKENKDTGFKILGKEVAPPDATTLHVKVVANTSMWCDTAMDVLLRDSGKKSIRERKGLIPHLHDHEWYVDAEIGDVTNIYYEDRSLRELGLKQDGTAQALIMETDLIREWNEKVFNKYRTGRIKQHSIGLRYVDLALAINEPDDDYWEDEYKIWKKYFDNIINKDFVETRGYFYAVYEYMLLENSCVLFGANQLTPTLEAGEKSFTNGEPLVNTHHTPDSETDQLDIRAVIGGMKLFN